MAGGAAIPQQSVMDEGNEYRCGECAKDVIIKAKDAIRCRECGYRILMKKRTKQVVQFEAR
mgnify:CR=1 FL=1